jgi:DNA polymerase III delta prime subunit
MDKISIKVISLNECIYLIRFIYLNFSQMSESSLQEKKRRVRVIKKKPTSVELLDIHGDIKQKLQHFIEHKKIPNIIFHGVSGCGKNTLAWNFVRSIYGNDKVALKDYVMHVNCAHNKGIRFIREDLKFFAKTNVDLKDGEIFKSVVLVNADKLTTDAQSALRRCIELFNHSTRFFIVVEDKYKLLRPILSRFCEIHVPEPIINGEQVNLHVHLLKKTFAFEKLKQQRAEWLEHEVSFERKYTYDDLISLAGKLHERAYSSIDLLKWLEKSNIAPDVKYEKLIAFQKVRHEFRNEKLLMLFMLHFMLLRSDTSLENIAFM